MRHTKHDLRRGAAVRRQNLSLPPSLTIPLFLSLRTAGTTLIPLFFLSIFEQNKDVVVLDGRLCWFSPLMPACLSLYRSVPLSLSRSIYFSLSLHSRRWTRPIQASKLGSGLHSLKGNGRSFAFGGALGEHAPESAPGVSKPRISR